MVFGLGLHKPGEFLVGLQVCPQKGVRPQSIDLRRANEGVTSIRTFGIAQSQIISIGIQYSFPLAGVLAALVPMRQAARMQIIAALRYE